MPIRYCLQCAKTTYEEEAYYENGHPYCLRCDYLLYYFGREQGSVSSTETLLLYDGMHPYDPVGDFQGKVVNLDTPKPDVNILECESMLAQNPANEKALFYLGLHYKSDNNVDRSLVYFETLEGVNPYDVGMNRELGDLYMKIRYFPEAIVCFERLLDYSDRPMDALYQLGLAYYFNKQVDRAVICFRKVQDGDDPDRSKQARLVLAQFEMSDFDVGADVGDGQFG